jgi:hypothetical protein
VEHRLDTMAVLVVVLVHLGQAAILQASLVLRSIAQLAATVVTGPFWVGHLVAAIQAQVGKVADPSEKTSHTETAATEVLATWLSAI